MFVLAQAKILRCASMQAFLRLAHSVLAWWGSSGAAIAMTVAPVRDRIVRFTLGLAVLFFVIAAVVPILMITTAAAAITDDIAVIFAGAVI